MARAVNWQDDDAKHARDLTPFLTRTFCVVIKVILESIIYIFKNNQQLGLEEVIVCKPFIKW